MFPEKFLKWMEDINDRLNNVEDYLSKATDDGRWQDSDHPILR